MTDGVLKISLQILIQSESMEGEEGWVREQKEKRKWERKEPALTRLARCSASSNWVADDSVVTAEGAAAEAEAARLVPELRFAEVTAVGATAVQRLRQRRDVENVSE